MCFGFWIKLNSESDGGSNFFLPLMFSLELPVIKQMHPCHWSFSRAGLNRVISVPLFHCLYKIYAACYLGNLRVGGAVLRDCTWLQLPRKLVPFPPVNVQNSFLIRNWVNCVSEGKLCEEGSQFFTYKLNCKPGSWDSLYSAISVIKVKMWWLSYMVFLFEITKNVRVCQRLILNEKKQTEWI